MKKKAPKVPDMYHGLTTDKDGTELCLVLDKHGQLFKFDNSSVCSIVSDGIFQKWGNFNAFDSWAERDHASYARLHEQVFRAPIDKQFDPIMTRVYVFKKCLSLATDRTTKATAPVDPETGRKSSILERHYFLGRDANLKEKVTGIKTPQAKACFEILRSTLAAKAEEMKKTATDDEVIVPSITEGELRKVVVTRQAELHTRQDPWRIFQYYRPTLLQDHLIRHD